MRNMETLKGIFDTQKPIHRKNFIQENVRQLREMQNCWQNRADNIDRTAKPSRFRSVVAKVPPHTTGSNTRYKEQLAYSEPLPKGRLVRSAQLAPKILVTSQSNTAPQSAKGPQHREAIHANRNSTYGREVRNSPKTKKGGNEENPLLLKGDVAEFVRRQRARATREKELRSTASDQTFENSLSECTSTESVKCHKGPLHSRNMASQTLDPSSMDKIESEGVIRYPSSRRAPPRHIKSPTRRLPSHDMGLQTELASPKRLANKLKPLIDKLHSPTSADGDKSSNTKYVPDLKNLPERELDDSKCVPDLTNLPDCGLDDSVLGLEETAEIVNSSKQNTLTNRSKSSGRSTPNPLRPPPHYQKGAVPKYLKERQEEWQKELEIREQETPDPSCPSGHVPLPDSERKETLRMLRKSYADLVQELNMMPVRTDTLRMRQRKGDLERQLNKLDEGIKVFSRPKVFVKIGA